MPVTMSAGIVGTDSKRQCKPWTQKEIDAIYQYPKYKHVHYKTMPILKNRTEKAIRDKRSRLLRQTIQK